MVSTMAEKSQVQAGLHGRFPPGTKLKLVNRTGDWYAPGGDSVASATMGDDGVTFKNLEPGRYWVVGEVDGKDRAVAVTAKPTDGSAVPARQAQGKAERAQMVPPPRETPVKEGARSTFEAKLGKMTARQQEAIRRTALPAAHVPNEKDEREKAPAPALKQAEAEDVPQRSATPIGQATPRDVAGEEPQPLPSQQDVDDNTPQRSATEFGQATPKHIDEVVPAVKQEDAPDDLEQRSSTEHGQVEPVPQGKATAQEAAKDSPQAAAAGGVDEGVKLASKGQKATRETQAARAKASKSEVKD